MRIIRVIRVVCECVCVYATVYVTSTTIKGSRSFALDARYLIS